MSLNSLYYWVANKIGWMLFGELMAGLVAILGMVAGVQRYKKYRARKRNPFAALARIRSARGGTPAPSGPGVWGRFCCWCRGWWNWLMSFFPSGTGAIHLFLAGGSGLFVGTVSATVVLIASALFRELDAYIYPTFFGGFVFTGAYYLVISARAVSYETAVAYDQVGKPLVQTKGVELRLLPELLDKKKVDVDLRKEELIIFENARLEIKLGDQKVTLTIKKLSLWIRIAGDNDAVRAKNVELRTWTYGDPLGAIVEKATEFFIAFLQDKTLLQLQSGIGRQELAQQLEKDLKSDNKLAVQIVNGLKAIGCELDANDAVTMGDISEPKPLEEINLIGTMATAIGTAVNDIVAKTNGKLTHAQAADLLSKKFMADAIDGGDGVNEVEIRANEDSASSGKKKKKGKGRS